MAHYAFIKDNLVTEVITGIDENDTSTLPSEYSSWEEFYLTQRLGQDVCKRTSYNTIGNTHIYGGTAFRGNYAGIGFIYDEANDVFYPPQPYPSWNLNQSTWTWEAPITYPDDGNYYDWNEENQSWDLQE